MSTSIISATTEAEGNQRNLSANSEKTSPPQTAPEQVSDLGATQLLERLEAKNEKEGKKKPRVENSNNRKVSSLSGRRFIRLC